MFVEPFLGEEYDLKDRQQYSEDSQTIHLHGLRRIGGRQMTGADALVGNLIAAIAYESYQRAKEQNNHSDEGRVAVKRREGDTASLYSQGCTDPCQECALVG